MVDNENYKRDKKLVTKQMKNRLQLLKYLAIACATVCIILLIVCLAFVLGDAKYECPDLSGLTEEEVRSSYGDVFGDIIVEYKEDNTHPIGTVITQSIAKGDKMKEGDVITITISSGSAGDKTRVPNLSGKTLEEATELLNIADLVLKIEREQNDLYIPGVVIRTEPDSNALVSKGSSVTIYINEGAESTKTNKVPNVTYQTYDDAVKALEVAGLEVGEKTEVNSTYPKGMVIVQAIKADTMVEKGSKIDLIISNGIKAPIIEVTLPRFSERVEGDVVIYCNSQRQDNLTIEDMLFGGKKVTLNLSSDKESGVCTYEIYAVSSEINEIIYSCDVDFKTGEVTNQASYVYSYIPDVVNSDLESARELLESYGFATEVEQITVAGDSAPVVSQQYPVSSADVYLANGLKVRLIVTVGESYVG